MAGGLGGEVVEKKLQSTRVRKIHSVKGVLRPTPFCLRPEGLLLGFPTPSTYLSEGKEGTPFNTRFPLRTTTRHGSLPYPIAPISL